MPTCLATKFKKNLLKDLKLSKEINNLIPCKRQSSSPTNTSTFSIKPAFSRRNRGKVWAFEAIQATSSRAGRTNCESSHSNRNKTQRTESRTIRYDTKFICNFSSFANRVSNPTVRVHVPLGGRLRFFPKNWSIAEHKRSIYF